MKHFLDIGGNNGQTFDYLDTLDRSFKDHIFWVFEPSPRHFDSLLKKCKERSNEYNIKVCPFGIGGKSEVRLFMEKDDLMGDSFQDELASDHAVFNVNNGYAVYSYIMSITDFILKNTQPEDSIVLDIDCEGSEYEILFDLINSHDALSRVKEAWVEWHHIKTDRMVISPKEFTEICLKNNITVTHRGDAA
jgi:FkbM family methyltransferase